MSIDPRLHAIAARQPHPLLFATISGAHLYGFPSPDSDYDLRGVHILPLRAPRNSFSSAMVPSNRQTKAAKGSHQRLMAPRLCTSA